VMGGKVEGGTIRLLKEGAIIDYGLSTYWRRITGQRVGCAYCARVSGPKMMLCGIWRDQSAKVGTSQSSIAEWMSQCLVKCSISPTNGTYGSNEMLDLEQTLL
jgi:hypothetical protein